MDISSDRNVLAWFVGAPVLFYLPGWNRIPAWFAGALVFSCDILLLAILKPTCPPASCRVSRHVGTDFDRLVIFHQGTAPTQNSLASSAIAQEP